VWLPIQYCLWDNQTLPEYLVSVGIGETDSHLILGENKKIIIDAR
jgi:hypothetical protein